MNEFENITVGEQTYTAAPIINGAELFNSDGKRVAQATKAPGGAFWQLATLDKSTENSADNNAYTNIDNRILRSGDIHHALAGFYHGANVGVRS